MICRWLSRLKEYDEMQYSTYMISSKHHLIICIKERYSLCQQIYPCLSQVNKCTSVFIQYWAFSHSYHNNDNNYVTYAHKKPTNGIKKQRRKFVVIWTARKSSTVWMSLNLSASFVFIPFPFSHTSFSVSFYAFIVWS